ncbi:hypothetical protein ON010_g2602 [Phytophthora cinnamomi]|nr:hypothetical protein ON010_g2602 [Phytophthora cinnamomi]
MSQTADIRPAKTDALHIDQSHSQLVQSYDSMLPNRGYVYDLPYARSCKQASQGPSYPGFLARPQQRHAASRRRRTGRCAGVDNIISALEPVKESKPTLSTTDLIVLAGQVALEDAGNVTIDFLGGCTDANNGHRAEGAGLQRFVQQRVILGAPERDVDRGVGEGVQG